jgi:hypothetical protein
VQNSFDPDDWLDIPFERPKKFTITYGGSLYQGLRDPEPLLDALLDEFAAGTIERDRVEVRLFVRPEEWLQKAVRDRGLQDVVQFRGFVARPDVLQAERATSVNLLLLVRDPLTSGVYTGKVFEYIGAGLPILAVGGPEHSVLRDLMSALGGRYARTREETRAALRSLYQMHVSGDVMRLDSSGTYRFSAIEMAGRFSDILNRLPDGARRG